MLDIVFGQALDEGTSWRHLLPQGGATAGFEAVGTSGLLRRLATLFGVSSAQSESGPRVAAWLGRLEAHAPQASAYAASFEVDPWGTAAHLLALRDLLVLDGWDGRPLNASARLADLTALDRLAEAPALPPGPADLARHLATTLAAHRQLPEPLRVRHVEPRAELPSAVRAILTRLEALGAQVIPFEAPALKPPEALATLRAALHTPPAAPAPLPPAAGVLVLDAETPWEAGELLASWLADHPNPRRTLVAAADTAWLEAALRRRSLPALGTSAPSPWRPALQVLPLRLSLGFAPRDPRFALELLTLPETPVPPRLARHLLSALLDSPGIDGPKWRQAIQDATEGAPDPQAVLDAVDRWFGGPAHDPDLGMPVAEVTRLCRIVSDQARRRAHAKADAAKTDAGTADAVLLRAAAVADELSRATVALGAERSVPWIQLLQMHDAIAGAGTSRADAVAESERPAICASPAAVLPGADEIVWWGFIGEAAGDVGTEPWTPAEARALRAAGVGVPEPGERRRAEARGWRKPFEGASQNVVLVRWRLAGGAATTPHPFADELTARLGADALSRVTLRAESLLTGHPAPAAPTWQPELHPCPTATPPAPRPLWRLPPEALRPRPPLSPSAIETLFGCPLKWTLHYAAYLRSGAAAGLPDDSRVVGTFAHRLIQSLLLDPAGPPDAETAYERVADDFDRSISGEAATLLRAGRDLDRTRARDTIASAARALVEALEESGLRAVGAETPTAGVLSGYPWRGSADLVLEGPRGKAILDLKQGGAAYRKDALVKGEALQLALYAQGLAETPDALPPAGFFIVGDRRLLTVDGETFTSAEPIDGPSLGETLVMADRAFTYWQRVMAGGLVRARGLADEDADAACDAAAEGGAPSEGPGAVKAPCRFCDFSDLCETAVGVDAAEAS